MRTSLILYYSSSESDVDLEKDFKHDIKPRRKRRKRRRNLALNQSRKKRKYFNYGEQCKIIKEKCDRNEDINDTVVSHTLEIEVNSEERVQLENDNNSLAIPVGNIPAVGRNINQSFFANCLDRIHNRQFIQSIIEKFQREGLLVHFMAFLEMLSSGQLSVLNMSVLLAMEVALLFSLSTTTGMRYREDTATFWEVVLGVGGPRTLRLFSSDKHLGQVNSGESERGKFHPGKGNFNFAVPDERLLKRSKTGIPKNIKCGIIEESSLFIENGKEYVLSLDGKQATQGLLGDMEGDVNLWDYEGPPTLKQNYRRLLHEENVILDITSSVSVDDTVLGPSKGNLKYIIQFLTARIRDLRLAKIRHEKLRKYFNQKIERNPKIGSRYSIAYSEINCFIRKCDDLIDRILQENLNICEIMSMVNGTEHCFRNKGPLNLDNLDNGLILRNYEDIPVGQQQITGYVKQKSDEWFRRRQLCCVTGSTMYNAIGLRNLKNLRDHYKRFISHKLPPQLPNAAMQFGSDNEVS